MKESMTYSNPYDPDIETYECKHSFQEEFTNNKYKCVRCGLIMNWYEAQEAFTKMVAEIYKNR